MTRTIDSSVAYFLKLQSSLLSLPIREFKARFKRRTLHVPNLIIMQMSENNRFFSFALDSAHVKFDV